METEKCDKCGVEVEKGTLIRDQVFDSSQLRCNVCIAPDKKPRKPRKRKEIPVIMAAPTIDWAAEKFLENPPAPIDPVALRQDAETWARECGLGKVVASGPTREDYPRYGFGYTFSIMEVGGKDRKATARYTCEGKRNFWTIDGMVTG